MHCIRLGQYVLPRNALKHMMLLSMSRSKSKLLKSNIVLDYLMYQGLSIKRHKSLLLVTFGLKINLNPLILNKQLELLTRAPNIKMIL